MKELQQLKVLITLVRMELIQNTREDFLITPMRLIGQDVYKVKKIVLMVNQISFQSNLNIFSTFRTSMFNATINS